jgi:hypothetical protein
MWIIALAWKNGPRCEDFFSVPFSECIKCLKVLPKENENEVVRFRRASLEMDVTCL